MPDKDHPIWKLAQSIIALIGIVWFSYHSVSAGNVDTDGVASGVGSGILSGKLLYQYLRS